MHFLSVGLFLFPLSLLIYYLLIVFGFVFCLLPSFVSCYAFIGHSSRGLQVKKDCSGFWGKGLFLIWLGFECMSAFGYHIQRYTYNNLFYLETLR